MTGFKVGDRVRVVGNTVVTHHYNIGDEVVVNIAIDTKRYGVTGHAPRSPFQIIYVDDLEAIEEYDTMAHNNGDLIKAQVGRDDFGSPVYNLFVKFGEFYYNLSTTKQMRGAKSLPSGSKRLVGTMTETGDHMLAAMEGKDSEVSYPETPFDSTPDPKEIRIPQPDGSEQIIWISDDSMSWEKIDSKLMTTDKLSDVPSYEGVKIDKYIRN